MGKVVGEPYRGKPDVRFDEGAEGNAGVMLLYARRLYSTNYSPQRLK